MAYLMIVDDDEEFADASATVLRDAGHEVRVMLDTADVADTMADRRPDLLILDVMFPEDPLAGMKLVEQIRDGDPGLSGIRILMLTAISSAYPAGSAGASRDPVPPRIHFLEKPIDFDVLCSTVNGLLQDEGRRPPGADDGRRLGD